jgi:hypothetical protein
MRMALKDLMEKLGVGRIMQPYETNPWFHYDADKGITCSAEVRVGPGASDIETEIQYLHDETGEAGETEGEAASGGPKPPQQIMLMRILPNGDGTWTTKYLRVNGDDYMNKVYNWEEKGCNFFRAFIEALQMSVLPNLEELIETELGDDDEFGGGRRGRVGRKSPGIKPGALLGMKKGM